MKYISDSGWDDYIKKWSEFSDARYKACSGKERSLKVKNVKLKLANRSNVARLITGTMSWHA